jgi:hypothetical protein
MPAKLNLLAKIPLQQWPARIALKLAKEATIYRNMHGRFEMRKRSRGSSHLLVIVAGYLPNLWEFTLERVARLQMADMDVCIVSPGVRVAKLGAICEKNGWSYLSTTANQLALAQNLAIREHKAAEWIFKIDEDIFVGEGYFEDLLGGFIRAEKEVLYRIGFAAPLLNVNGNTYVDFLNVTGNAHDYLLKFGELTRSAIEIKAHKDGSAAQFLWDASLPFDQVAAKVRSLGFSYKTIPHRFSIGAILLKRSLLAGDEWFSTGAFRRRAWSGRRAPLQRVRESLQSDDLSAERLRRPLRVRSTARGHDRNASRDRRQRSHP